MDDLSPMLERRDGGNRVAVGQGVLAIPWVKTQVYSWGIALRYNFTKHIKPRVSVVAAKPRSECGT